MRRAAAKHRREDDDEDEHQQQRMEHRPEEAEDRALVADGEIAVDELEEQPGVRANVASLAHPSQRLAGDTSALDEGNGRHPRTLYASGAGESSPLQSAACGLAERDVRLRSVLKRSTSSFPSTALQTICGAVSPA